MIYVRNPCLEVVFRLNAGRANYITNGLPLFFGERERDGDVCASETDSRTGY